MNLPHIKQKSTSFKTKYQWVVDLTKEQLRDFWIADHYHMKDDMHDFRTVLTKAERQAWIHSNIMINHYEGYLGNDVWGGRYKEIFPRYEFQTMGSVFAAYEDGIHAELYKQMMDALGLNTDEFHDRVKKDSIMAKRMKAIGGYLRDPDDLIFLASVTFLEGLGLYNILAFMMSFRKPLGLNAMKNAVSGVVHSTRDEEIHARGSSMSFKALKSELNLSEGYLSQLKEKIKKIGLDFYHNELDLSAQLFCFGELRNISKEALMDFPADRLNKCYELLGYPELKVNLNSKGEVSEWFYLLSQAQGQNDFFQTTGSEYEKSVNKSRFIW